ncbi:MAG: DUF3576 domain-containing protein [Rickettsiales bacterium]|nr:DUF3576 domain-containing protein [Rickettsiales bacterium]
MKSKFLFFICFLVICTTQPVYSESDDGYPETARERRRKGFGSVLGRDKDSGAVTIFGKTIGGEKKNEQSANQKGKESTKPVRSRASRLGYKGRGVRKMSSYLWQAALEFVQSMPILVTDSSSGLISTDWHEKLDSPNERYKFNILVRLDAMNAKDLNVTAFKQKLEEGNWKDMKVDPEVANKMRNKIFSKAKELRDQK